MFLSLIGPSLLLTHKDPCTIVNLWLFATCCVGFQTCFSTSYCTVLTVIGVVSCLSI